MKKNKMNIVVIVLSILILAVFIATGDFGSSIDVIVKSSPLWIGCAFLCIFIYWLAETLITHLMVKKLYNQQKFFNTFKTTMLGQFFNCTTPFASGGQPMQAYHMSTYGVSIGVGTSSLIARFIVYQSVLTIYSVIMLIINFNYFNEKIPGFTFIALIGFFINLGVVIFLYSVSLFKKPARIVFRFIFKFLSKIHLCKDLDKRYEQIDVEIDMFYTNFRIIKNYKSTLVAMTLLTIVQLTVYFAIPYFIALAFGIQNINFFLLISAQGFVLLISSFFPLPGAMGASEVSFVGIFTMFFKDPGQVQTAMLIWRFITFFMPIIVGSFFSVQFNKAVANDKDAENKMKKASGSV